MFRTQWLLLFFLAPCVWSANLAVSSYLKDGFAPTALGADAQGNIYLSGTAVLDPVAMTKGAMVAKIDARASQFLYQTFLDSAAGDQISGLAVDSAGNAYVAGSTTNPNFPVVGGGGVGSAPKGGTDQRGFVAKLDSRGAVVFAVLIGTVSCTARGIAVTPQGQILVSGVAGAGGFPVTQGAYNIGDSNNHWFLMELDAAAGKMIFSAVGIGGSSLAVDSGGNIYMAGSSAGTDYPTTGGAYQAGFTQGYYCFGLCQIGFAGNLQHVTKTDAAATKLIYSTGLNDPQGGAGSTTTTGMAVDSAGNVYVTGTLFEARYPFTVTPPQIFSGFVSKLDPAGANLLFSIPFGGAGVQLDASGGLYAAGTVMAPSQVFSPSPVKPDIPGIFSWLPAGCRPDSMITLSGAYGLKLDPATGAIQDGQWIDGASPAAAAMVLAGGKVWMTGTASAPDVPFTPGVPAPFAPLSLEPGYLPGGWVAAADFSGGPHTGPEIGCVLDAGNLTHVAGVTGFQLLTILGRNLGPATGVAAPDGADPSIAAVTATFDGNNTAQLLYVSSTQINLAVPLPLPSREVSSWPTATAMQLNVNGATVQRQFPYMRTNLNLFANLSAGPVSCAGASSGTGYQPLATNPDGSANSCGNPAPSGSTVSFYMHGIGAFQLGFPPEDQIASLAATVGYCSAQVTSAKWIGQFVYQVNVTMPVSPQICARVPSPSPKYQLPVVFTYSGVAVGPFPPGAQSPGPYSGPGSPLPVSVFVSQ